MRGTVHIQESSPAILGTPASTLNVSTKSDSDNQIKAPPQVCQHLQGLAKPIEHATDLHEDIIPLPPAGRKTKGGIILKLRIETYNGTRFLLEWEEMESGRFYALLALVGLPLFLKFFLELMSL